MQMCGIRGATTCKANTSEEIILRTENLLNELIEANSLEIHQVCSIIFTVTRDLDAVFPGWVARTRLQLGELPVLDMQHMHVDGDLARCIRVLVTINTDQHSGQMQHIYQQQAVRLRPDRAAGDH